MRSSGDGLLAWALFGCVGTCLRLCVALPCRPSSLQIGGGRGCCFEGRDAHLCANLARRDETACLIITLLRSFPSDRSFHFRVTSRRCPAPPCVLRLTVTTTTTTTTTYTSCLPVTFLLLLCSCPHVRALSAALLCSSAFVFLCRPLIELCECVGSSVWRCFGGWSSALCPSCGAVVPD